MSAERAKEFYHHAAKSEAIREELKGAWQGIEAVAKKHGFEFTMAEYYDFLHEHTGMTKVSKSNSDPHVNLITIFCV